MKTQIEIRHNKLVKRYFFLLRKLNRDGFSSDEIRNLIKEGPMDMDNETLMTVCLKFERVLNPRMPETETMRKKVIDAIGNWMELYGREKDIEAAKVKACIESGIQLFDEIPVNKLRCLFNEFKKKQNEFLSIEKELAKSIDSYNSSGPKQVFYGGKKIQNV